MKLNNQIRKPTLTALCVLALSPALLFAGNPPKPAQERGVIKSVDLTAHTLVVTAQKKNTEQKFQWNDQTKFTAHDQAATASALKAGERVQLAYTDGTGKPVLQSVRIALPKTDKPGAKNTSPAGNPGT